MARKKIDSNGSRLPLELMVRSEEAISRLQDRISKGSEIKERNIHSQEELNTIKSLYYRWNDFNEELLKRLFSIEEISDEYSQGVGFYAILPSNLDKDIKDLHSDIDYKINRLESIIDRVELIPFSTSIHSEHIHNSLEPNRSFDKNRIFIVHGHDNEIKIEVARFIERIGYTPIILHEQASGSKTIIEKIESYSDVGFGIVIYTPCDLGAKNADSPKFHGRARQNVVFEHGFLIGKLGRGNVCSLVKGDVETPNDISGIVYTSMETGNWQIQLSRELRSAGYMVDMNKVL